MSHRRFAVSALVVLLAACGPKPAPSVAPAAAAPAAEPGTDAGDADRMKRVEEALARLPDIQTRLEELRELKFKNKVKGAYQGPEDFKAYLETQIKEELPPKKNEAMSRAMYHIGMLETKVDIASIFKSAVAAQAGGYYDPKTKEFYLTMVPKQVATIDALSAHELTHALQDQHFALEGYMGGRGNEAGLNDDTLQARRFVVEGEASLVMQAYVAKAMMGADALAAEFRDQLRGQLTQVANMDIAQLRKMNAQSTQGFETQDEEMKRAMESMDSIPNFVLVPLIDAYTKGMLPVFEAHADGGWPGVAKLYSEPPMSTEQVLHPVEKLLKKRDHPTTLELAKLDKALPGSEAVYENVIGELMWGVYFLNWGISDGKQAAAGWDGDRYRVLANGDSTVAVISTVWDSENDAKEFEKSYLGSLAKRFPKAEPAPKPHSGVTRPDGTLVVVQRKKAKVHIVDGAPKDKAKALLKAVRKTKTKK